MGSSIKQKLQVKDMSKEIISNKTKSASKTLLPAIIPLNTDKRFLSNDRKWTLFFWLGLTASLTFGSWIKNDLGMTDVAVFAMIILIPSVVLTTLLCNKTIAVSDSRLTNNKGFDIDDEKVIGSESFASAIVNIFIIFILDQLFFSSPLFFSSDAGISILPLPVIIFLYLAGFCAYFFIRNCPISILLHRRIWKEFKLSEKEKEEIRQANAKSHDEWWHRRTSPAYSYLASNHHHR